MLGGCSWLVRFWHESRHCAYSVTFTQPDDNQSHVCVQYMLCCAFENKQSHIYTAILQSIAGLVLYWWTNSHIFRDTLLVYCAGVTSHPVPIHWCSVPIHWNITINTANSTGHRNNNEGTLMAVQTIRVVKVLAGYIIPALSNQYLAWYRSLKWVIAKSDILVWFSCSLLYWIEEAYQRTQCYHWRPWLNAERDIERSRVLCGVVSWKVRIVTAWCSGRGWWTVK